MKHLIALSFILLSPIEAAETQVEIRMVSSHHQATTLYWLKEDQNKEIYCKTEETPWHRIKVAGLRGIKAPYSVETKPLHCEQTLTWGKAQICYNRHQNPVVDDVLRWCRNL